MFTDEAENPLNLSCSNPSKGKQKTKNFKRMKTLKTSFILLSLLIAAACNDDNETASNTAVSNDEAAEIVASSISEDASGLTVVVTDAAVASDEAMEETSNGRTAACGYSQTISISKTSPESSLITYSYNYDYFYQMTCSSEDVPLSITADVSYTGQFDAPRLASQHSGTSDLSVNQLESSEVYRIEGAYTRSGAFQSKIKNKNSHTSDVVITIDSVTVDKASKQITSGAASFSIVGEVSGKGGFSISGTIVFNGAGNATVSIAGESYTVDLESGDVE